MAVSLVGVGLFLAGAGDALAQSANVAKPQAVAPDGIQRVAMQGRRPAEKGPSEESQEYFVPLELPGPQRLFRLESEKSLQERMRQEALSRPTPERIEFPEYKPLTDETKLPRRSWPCQTIEAEPAYLCYGRLFFEDLNTERYGWDLGFLAPFVSAGHFYKDVVLLPYHWATDPCRHFECSAGYCLPGDPVPYLLYPPHLSLCGGAAETATILALLAIFP